MKVKTSINYVIASTSTSSLDSGVAITPNGYSQGEGNNDGTIGQRTSHTKNHHLRKAPSLKAPAREWTDSRPHVRQSNPSGELTFLLERTQGSHGYHPGKSDPSRPRKAKVYLFSTQLSQLRSSGFKQRKHRQDCSVSGTVPMEPSNPFVSNSHGDVLIVHVNFYHSTSAKYGRVVVPWERWDNQISSILGNSTPLPHLA